MYIDIDDVSVSVQIIFKINQFNILSQWKNQATFLNRHKPVLVSEGAGSSSSGTGGGLQNVHGKVTHCIQHLSGCICMYLIHTNWWKSTLI